MTALDLHLEQLAVPYARRAPQEAAAHAPLPIACKAARASADSVSPAWTVDTCLITSRTLLLGAKVEHNGHAMPPGADAAKRPEGHGSAADAPLGQ